MNYSQAIEFVDSFINYEKTRSFDYPEAMKLDRMKALAKALGNPQKSYESIIIAGSKGKGSTAAILSSILRMDDLKVGLYTSPHLEELRERIRVNNLMISENRFVEIVLLLRGVLDTAQWRKDPPTHFELLTAMALLYFQQMKVQVAVLEVGLGGLYDSTNIVLAKVVGLSPISLEHTDKLGKTLSKIAVQKCGVIKGREIVVSAPQAKEVRAVIHKAVEANEAECFEVGAEIKISEREHGPHFQRFDIKSTLGNFFGLELKLLGAHQIENAAVAIGLAKALERKTRLVISDSAVRQGIADARWPGRIEKIGDDPAIVLDGAHNPESVKRLMQALKRHFQYEKLIVAVGVSDDKDLAGMLHQLAPDSWCLIACQSSNPRALPAKVLAQSCEGFHKKVIVETDTLRVLETARSIAGPQDLILVTGSLYLVGEVRSAFVAQESRSVVEGRR